MKRLEGWHKADSAPSVEISFKLDTESFSWLASESERTGIPIEVVSSAVMRRACAEKEPIGAPNRNLTPKIFQARIAENGDVILPKEWDE